MSKTVYRVVIDEFTDENVGVVKIDLKKWKGDHYIIDPDGDERKKYSYRNIDESKYDTVVAFETHKILKVKYKSVRHWLATREEHFVLILFAGFSATVLCAYILGGVIMFSDIAPALGNNIWYQAIYWLTLIPTVVGGVGLLASLRYDVVLAKPTTRKDDRIKEWLAFQEISDHNSQPEK